jgi:hypothetical protein
VSLHDSFATVPMETINAVSYINYYAIHSQELRDKRTSSINKSINNMINGIRFETSMEWAPCHQLNTNKVRSSWPYLVLKHSKCKTNDNSFL